MNFLCMGVMNVTPNSFSDGGLYFDPLALQNHLKLLSKQGVDIIDIGAESTAPFNKAISADEEKARLLSILSLVGNEDLNFKAISLDTYKSEVALWFFEELAKCGVSQDKFIWNDVSGKLDDEVTDFLMKYPKARYVLCHNRAPSRAKAAEHMNYVDEKIDIFNEVLDSFKEAMNHEQINQIIFDPCFGFSKSYEQNLELVNRFGELTQRLVNQSWVFGISKKSFLRCLWQREIEPDNQLIKEELLLRSEYFHHEFLMRIMKACPKTNVLFRVHDPLIYKSSLFLTTENLTKN